MYPQDFTTLKELRNQWAEHLKTNPRSKDIFVTKEQYSVLESLLKPFLSSLNGKDWGGIEITRI